MSSIALPAPYERSIVIRLPRWMRPWEQTKEDTLVEAIAFRTPTFADYEVATRSPSVNKPVGTADGDLLIELNATDTVHVFTPFTGWSLIASLDQATDTTVSAAYKIASGEPASWTFTNQYSTTEVGTTVVIAISGVDQTTPFDVAATTLASAAANTQNWASILPVSNDVVVLGLGGSDPSSSARAATPAAGWTELVDHTETPNSINGWVYALYKQLVGAPSAQTPSITIDGGGSNTMAKITVALRPASAGAAASFPTRRRPELGLVLRRSSPIVSKWKREHGIWLPDRELVPA